MIPRTLALAFCIALPSFAVPAQTRTVRADVSRVSGPHTNVPLRVIGAGRANEGLRADWQQQLATVQREIGFQYIRMHGILNDDMGVYTEDSHGNPQYNFQYVDALYDALLKLHIRPCVELTFMPSKLASGPQMVFWWKGNITPPKDPEKWSALIRAFTAHMKARYGEDEISRWYFEVWNEPDLQNLFFTGNVYDYLALYKNTAEAVKAECSACRVGGPASAMPWKFEEAFEQYIAAKNVPADFVSSHAYGVSKGFLDAEGRAGTILDPSPDSISGRDEALACAKLIQRIPAAPTWSYTSPEVEFVLHADRLPARPISSGPASSWIRSSAQHRTWTQCLTGPLRTYSKRISARALRRFMAASA